MSNMASRIRTARKASGFNQERFAFALGVGRRTVQRWETGQVSPTVENVIAIARETGKSAGYLLGDEEESSMLDLLYHALGEARTRTRERVA